MTLEAARTLQVARRGRGAASPLAPAIAALMSVIGLAAAQGGFFSTSWGWVSVPLFWAAALALVLRAESRLSGWELVMIGAAAAFTSWLAISTLWSVAPAESVLEVERSLVYVAVILGVLVLAGERSVRAVLGAVLAAVSVIAAFSLATRLFPDRVGVYDRTSVYRLAEPIGYWNGLALFTAVGVLLALGFATRARTAVARCACSAALVLLLPTFYFTFGRGAWIALAAGIVASVAADPRRLQFVATGLAVAVAPAVSVFLASREYGLTHAGTALARAEHDGHRFALVLLLLAVANAAVGALAALVERRVRLRAALQRAFAAGVAVVALAAVVVGLVTAGGPVQIVKRAYASFTAPPPHVAGNLNRRLLSFSGNGRADLWRLAWDDFRNHPVLGAGAGTYERYFLAHQPANVGRVRDAHSLYVETLAEVGPIGLVLLLTLLLTPVAALRSARGHPLVPAAFGAYVVYLVHTGVDWDWELPAVTLAGLICGAAILLARREGAPPAPLSSPLRWTLAGAAAAAATFAAIALIGNTALSRSETARERADYGAAAADARRARTLLPWSPTPWEALGRAQVAAGFAVDARHSFDKALELDRGNWQLWYELANVTTGRERSHALQRVALLFPRSGLVEARK